MEDVIDPLGRRAQHTEYGPDGRVVAVIDAQGNRIAQSFDPANFTGTRTDARGNVTTLVYNARGNLLEERKPEGGITRYEYADTANPDKETAIIDPRGNRTTFTYDARGHKLPEPDPLGTVTTYAYNALNKITSLQRRNATGTLQSSEAATYDAAGNLTRITNAAGHHRDFVYDLQSRLVSSTDFEGNVTTYDYTAGCPCGSPSTITYADGSTKLLEYNSLGQVTKVTDETGAITRSAYDANGRKISETDHDGKVTTFEYDANNNLLKRTDRLGRIAKFIYDDKNRLTREIKLLTNDSNDTNDVILNYEYDADGHLTALIDPVGNRTEFSFDRDGRMTTRRDAAGASTTVSYDLAGNTSAIVDRNSRKRSFLYNERNQPTAERWHAPDDSILRTIAITYDDLGRRATIADPDSAYAWQYDSSSRITQVSNAGTPGLPAVTLFHSYDKDGRLTSVIDNAGMQVQTTHDVRGRSDHFIWTGGGISPASVDIDRNGRGQITSLKRFADSTLTNQVSRTTYDQIAPQGWVKQIQHKNAAGALYNAGTNFTYGYDVEGQVTSQSSQGNSTTYGYDLTGQLTSANHTDAAYPDETYSYDKAGNRTTSHLHTAYTTGTANRLQSDGLFNFSYDAEGNLITKTEIATGKVTNLAYDHRGRVTSIVKRASAGGAVLNQQSYVFDVLDRRITLNVNGTITHIAYQQDNAWADYSAAGGATARYLFTNRIDGNLAKWTPGTGTQWYLSDKLGSIRGLAASSGGLTNSVAYDSFGNNLVGGGIFATERYGFTAREVMPSGNYFYRSRLLNSLTGVFNSEDHIRGKSGDFGLYRYVFNAPINYSDPTGASALEYGILVDTVANGPAGAAIGRFIGYLHGYSATNLIYLGLFLGGSSDIPDIQGGLDDFAKRIGDEIDEALDVLEDRANWQGKACGKVSDALGHVGIEVPCTLSEGFAFGFGEGSKTAIQRLKTLGLIK
ncbi:MAG: RHS repeat protein [Verrucomicrobiaceae bacterium]|nr:RHS repeat protein [Verrucomicrobiaceae bacterium]